MVLSEIMHCINSHETQLCSICKIMHHFEQCRIRNKKKRSFGKVVYKDNPPPPPYSVEKEF